MPHSLDGVLLSARAGALSVAEYLVVLGSQFHQQVGHGQSCPPTPGLGRVQISGAGRWIGETDLGPSGQHGLVRTTQPVRSRATWKASAARVGCRGPGVR